MRVKVVRPDKLYRGPRPPNFQEFSALVARQGIGTVICLESGFFEWFRTKRNEELGWCHRLRVDLIHIRCHPFLPPTADEVGLFLSMVKEAEGPVYFHCLHGVDRTGWMASMYRVMMQGWDVNQAMKEMYDNGFHRWSYWWWPKFARKFPNGIGGKSGL